MKSWYFERDCPFCTRSVSSFSRNPLYFLAHAMWVKWGHHANFQPFQSSFVVLFSISGSYSSKKSVNAWKITNEVRKGLYWWRGFEWCILNAQKVWSWNKFNKMKCLCNRWVFVRNPDTSKEIVHFVHEVHPVFVVTLPTF